MDKFDRNGLKSLFATSQSSNANKEENTLAANNTSTDGHTKKTHETYKDYGFRIAGLCEGNSLNLSPCLQSVYLGIKKEQENDSNLQQQLQNDLKNEKAKLEEERENKHNLLHDSQEKQETIKREIDKSIKELADLEDSRYKKNREAWITLIISGILLLPFTIYFFIFYSSVAYSAFFKTFDINSLDKGGNFILSQAIFDAAAIPNALNDGIGELIFILFMPIIFLAFGFVLNRWEREEGWLKYIKIPLLIIAAFLFDSLLSFEICEKIYNLNSLMSITERPEYCIPIAMSDPRFWIIICLGFVSYLIWGFVFGYFIKAWENLDLNQVRKKEIDDKLKTLEESLQNEKTNHQDLRTAINKINTQIIAIQSKMQNSARFDFARIEFELNNFYSGWQQYLAACSNGQNRQEEALVIFNKMIETIQTT